MGLPESESDKPIDGIENLLIPDSIILNYDLDCSRVFGNLRGQMLNQGITVQPVDLMIAAVALVHNLTLVTHNTVDFQKVPNLRLDDWLTP